MNVGVVGLGIMGSAMVKKLVERGHAVTINNRTRDKAEPLLAAGASWAGTPADAARISDVLISMVTDPDAAQSVSLSAGGIAEGLRPNAVHAEMSTISPDRAASLAAEYARRGLRYVQAPALGSRAQIEKTQLLVVAGGGVKDVDACRPVWAAFAKQVWRTDTAEQAAAMKLAANMLMAQMIVGLGQSLTFVKRFDLLPGKFLEIVAQSALAAPQYQAKGASILKGEYAPSFTVPNLLKDLRLGAEAAKERGVEMPSNDLAKTLFSEAVAAGFDDEDYSAVVKLFARQAGVDLSQSE